MKKYHSFLWIFILMLSISYQACNPHSRNSGCISTYYRLNKLNINSLQITNATGINLFYSSDSNAVATIAQTDMLGLNLAFNINYYSLNGKRGFSIFPTLQADVPICLKGDLGTQERIKNIVITSDNDFDTQHLANESLNDLFFVQTQDSSNLPFNEYLSSLYLETPQTSLINAHLKESFSILLNAKPSLETNHVFSVSVEYTDGRKFESKSWKVVFL